MRLSEGCDFSAGDQDLISSACWEASPEAKIVFGTNHGFTQVAPVEYSAASAIPSAETSAVCVPSTRAKYVCCVLKTSTLTERLATSTLTVTFAAVSGWPSIELFIATSRAWL